jgi:hypothetical protein
VTEVATRALKAQWFQKWFVHRRLRPEAFGGRIHAHLTQLRDYSMIDSEVLDSTALKLTNERTGTFLLPQAFSSCSVRSTSAHREQRFVMAPRRPGTARGKWQHG